MSKPRALLIENASKLLETSRKSAVFPKDISVAMEENKLSTYEVGSRYEELVITTIKKLRCDVKGLGGANDSGIDFLGRWNLDLRKKSFFSLVGQCKNYQEKSVGPSVVREFEGVMSRHDSENTVGMIATPLGFTKNAIETMMSSKFPLCMLIINFASLEAAKLAKDRFESKLLADIAWEKIKTGDTSRSNRGIIKGLLWNTPASALLRDVIVTTKYSRKTSNSSNFNEVSVIYKSSILY